MFWSCLSRGVELLMVTLDPTPETRAPLRVTTEPATAAAGSTALIIDGIADLASEALDQGASIPAL